MELKKQWLESVRRARDLFGCLPSEDVGCLYLDTQDRPIAPDPDSPTLLGVRRNFGSVRGAWPAIRE